MMKRRMNSKVIASLLECCSFTRSSVFWKNHAPIHHLKKRVLGNVFYSEERGHDRSRVFWEIRKYHQSHCDRRLEHGRIRTCRTSRRKLQSPINMETMIHDEDELTAASGGRSNWHAEPPYSGVHASDRQISDFAIVKKSSEDSVIYSSIAWTAAGASLQAARETKLSLMSVSVGTRHRLSTPSARLSSIAEDEDTTDS